MKSPTVTASAILVVCAASAASTASASETWEAECAEPPVMPVIEEAIPPVPQAGKWRGKGFGNKRKSNDVEIKECGRRIEGLIGVRLKGNVPHMVALELDEDDGRYKASFTYTEGGMAAVVTWNLEAESASRITGRMTIMGRGDQVEANLLEAAPSPELEACECEAVQNRRADLDRTLTEHKGEAQTVATWGWTTDPDSCAIRATTPDLGLPTQASFEALMRADWEGELVHRERCCTVSRAGGDGSTKAATYSEWVRASTDEKVNDEIAALTAQRDAIDSWLQNRCEE